MAYFSAMDLATVNPPENRHQNQHVQHTDFVVNLLNPNPQHKKTPHVKLPNVMHCYSSNNRLPARFQSLFFALGYVHTRYFRLEKYAAKNTYKMMDAFFAA